MINDYTDKTGVDQWTTGYNLRNKLQCAPPGFANIIKGAEASDFRCLISSSP